MPLTKTERNRLSRERRRIRDQFQQTLYIGCCVCELCGVSGCPTDLGGGAMTFHHVTYSVCEECMNHPDTWTGQVVPNRPFDRPGTMVCGVCRSNFTRGYCPSPDCVVHQSMLEVDPQGILAGVLV